MNRWYAVREDLLARYVVELHSIIFLVSTRKIDSWFKGKGKQQDWKVEALLHDIREIKVQGVKDFQSSPSKSG